MFPLLVRCQLEGYTKGACFSCIHVCGTKTECSVSNYS